jgi:hypothetical protein
MQGAARKMTAEVSTTSLISKEKAAKTLTSCLCMPAPSLAKVDDRVAGAAQQALQTLIKNRRCAAFVYEVEPEELGLVNYFKIVTEPMHLDLVVQKLQVAPSAALARLLHALN